MKPNVLLFLFYYMAFGIFSLSAEEKKSQKTVIGIKYFNRTMGNVHQNPSRYSQVLTTISCNHPVKVMKEISKDGKELILYGEENWNLVSIGPYEGYLFSNYLSDKKAECFEEEYSKFYDGLGLDINDLYYWARLYDQYVQGKSKVKQ